ncbi:MAG: bacteriochlorophyll/chlorophyll synthetase family protein, partial [Pseudomonadota bacterium]
MALPQLSAVTELFKPITWFPPMWAFACGIVASGVAMDGKWLLAAIGIALFSERREEPHHPMFLRTCWFVPPVNPLIKDFKETVYDQIVSAAH